MYLATEQDRSIYFEHHAVRAGRSCSSTAGVRTRCWDTTAPALSAAGHEVVSLDLRACGRSDKDFDDVSIDALAGDVVVWSTTWVWTGR